MLIRSAALKFYFRHKDGNIDKHWINRREKEREWLEIKIFV